MHGDGKNAFLVNGQAQSDSLGWQANLADVKWAHLAGTVPGTDIGWVFPASASLKALREARTGSWRQNFINDANIVDHTRNYLTLWYDHGTNPVGATYAYVLLPGKSAEQVKAYAANPGVEILANTPAVQAVASKKLGVTGANFWTDAGGQIGGIHCSGKAAVLVQDMDGKLSVGVADPTQLGKTVEIALDATVTQVAQVDDGVKVSSLRPVKFSITLDKSDGKTFTAVFRK